MIWSSNEELNSTRERVRNHCESLKKELSSHDLQEVKSPDGQTPGVAEDLERHKNDQIPTDPITTVSFRSTIEQVVTDKDQPPLPSFDSSDSNVVAPATISVASDEDGLRTADTENVATTPGALKSGEESASVPTV
jgi:hypothetical protein